MAMCSPISPRRERIHHLVGYANCRDNLSESSVRDRGLRELGIDFGDVSMPYGHHFGRSDIGSLIADFSGANISASKRHHCEHAQDAPLVADFAERYVKRKERGGSMELDFRGRGELVFDVGCMRFIARRRRARRSG